MGFIIFKYTLVHICCVFFPGIIEEQMTILSSPYCEKKKKIANNPIRQRKYLFASFSLSSLNLILNMHAQWIVLLHIFENEKVQKFCFHAFLPKFRPFLFYLDLD